MPDERGWLFTRDVAQRLDIEPSTWRSRVNRGKAPEPDGRVEVRGSLWSVWRPERIDHYVANRPRRGRPPKTPLTPNE